MVVWRVEICCRTSCPLRPWCEGARAGLSVTSIRFYIQTASASDAVPSDGVPASQQCFVGLPGASPWEHGHLPTRQRVVFLFVCFLFIEMFLGGETVKANTRGFGLLIPATNKPPACLSWPVRTLFLAAFEITL